MSETLMSSLGTAPIVPLVQSDDPRVAVKTTEALIEGGLRVIEVVLRTDGALKCLEAIVKAFPDAHVGAGTVLSAELAKKSIDNGAQFIVSPGLDESVVNVTRQHNMPILPGIATATELQRAWNMDLRLVKFFPAGLVGGPKMLKALSSVFRDVQFMPTGGVSPATLPEYLAVPAVLACGGTWLTPNDVIETGEFHKITQLAKEALILAAQTRP